MIYLDANATEPLRPEARAATVAALDVLGNPASVHANGRAARKLLEDCRAMIAARFGARPEDVVFTSGGTEANALAIHAQATHIQATHVQATQGQATRAQATGRPVLVGATEHDAVRMAAPGAAIVPVDRRGVVDLDALDRLLAAAPPALVCLMLANNETGVLHPIVEAVPICRRYGARLHVDAVQAAGRIGIDMTTLGADSIAISSHKLGGPAGAGALLLARSAPAAFAPLIAGGGQERGRRGGTPALPAIAGFAAAAQAASDGAASDGAALAPLRAAAERAAVAAGAVVCGADAPRLPNTASLALPGVRADAQVIALDLAGLRVSAGAACSSGKVAESHVLAAMGLGPLAGQAIRLSLPWNATIAHVEAFAHAYAAMATRLGSALAARAA